MGDLSCTTCHERHLRCSKETPCRNCRLAGITCKRTTQRRFRLNTTPAFPRGQIWVALGKRVSFVQWNEGDDGTASSLIETGDTNQNEAYKNSTTRQRRGNFQARSREDPVTDSRSTRSATLCEEYQAVRAVSSNDAQGELDDRHDEMCLREFDTSSLSSTTVIVGTSNDSSAHPSGSATLGTISENYESPYSDVHHSEPSCKASQFPLSRTASTLVRHFFRNLAPWFNYCDTHQQFTRKVSSSLSESPPLLYAVLAVSAQHLHVLNGFDFVEADKYHQACLQLLIPQLSRRDIIYRDDILAATVILRLRAEFEVPSLGFDDRSHLLGTQALLQAYRDIDELTTFQTSAAWVGLRQDIRVAVLAQSCVTFPLTCFSMDFASQTTDCGLWANGMVYHLAETLNRCCGSSSLTSEDHDNLAARGLMWMDSRPVECGPVYFEQATGVFRFPIEEYIADAAATGMQHYYLSNILLAFYHPARRLLRPGHHRIASQMDDVIDVTIRSLCGVRLSNSDCACAIGLACSGICLCRERFCDPEDQKVFDQILAIAKERHAWQS